MSFSVDILGCGSAMPTAWHNPACQIVDYNDRLMMIDCGEGAQAMMRKLHLKFSRLTDIFISHLHGDHFLGLPGLLSTMALHECSQTVTIHCFEAGLDVLRHVMKVFCPDPGFNIVYNPIRFQDALILDTPRLTVESVRLAHRVPCVGFIFREKPKLRHINGPMVRFHNVPHYLMQNLRKGEDFTTADGRVIPNELLTTPPDPALSYAYLSDTAYCPTLAEKVHNVTLLYHEATYGEEYAALAGQRGHSTATEAATIARDAGVRHLLIGHFSKRYDGDETPLLEQARRIFPATDLAREGQCWNLSDFV